MHRDPKGYYTLLGITPDTNSYGIAEAYHRLVKKAGESGLTQEEYNGIMDHIYEACVVLMDVKSRKMYDRHWEPYSPVHGYRRQVN